MAVNLSTPTHGTHIVCHSARNKGCVQWRGSIQYCLEMQIQLLPCSTSWNAFTHIEGLFILFDS
jgi:hypothetical protein